MTQQNPNPQDEKVGVVAGKNKRPRPYVIESRFTAGGWLNRPEPTKWRKHGAYRTERERADALEKYQRIYGTWIEFRLVTTV